MISSSQRPLPDNTQHSQQTNIHTSCGIRTHDLSSRAAEDLRLRPRGHWDRHPLLAPRLSKHRAMLLLHLWAFVACARVTSTITVTAVLENRMSCHPWCRSQFIVRSAPSCSLNNTMTVVGKLTSALNLLAVTVFSCQFAGNNYLQLSVSWE